MQAKRRADWNRAGELQHGIIPSLESQLKEASQVKEESPMLSEEVRRACLQSVAAIHVLP
jgi:predicted translin family RNA/ssDNA-binding protein